MLPRSPTGSRFQKNRGQTLVGVIVTAGITGIVAISFISMFKNQATMSRSIAATGGVNDLGHALDILFGGVQCATSGSSIFSLGGTSPVQVSLNRYDLIPDRSGRHHFTYFTVYFRSPGKASHGSWAFL